MTTTHNLWPLSNIFSSSSLAFKCWNTASRYPYKLPVTRQPEPDTPTTRLLRNQNLKNGPWQWGVNHVRRGAPVNTWKLIMRLRYSKSLRHNKSEKRRLIVKVNRCQANHADHWWSTSGFLFFCSEWWWLVIGQTMARPKIWPGSKGRTTCR